MDLSSSTVPAAWRSPITGVSALRPAVVQRKSLPREGRGDERLSGHAGGRRRGRRAPGRRHRSPLGRRHLRHHPEDHSRLSLPPRPWVMTLGRCRGCAWVPGAASIKTMSACRLFDVPHRYYLQRCQRFGNKDAHDVSRGTKIYRTTTAIAAATMTACGIQLLIQAKRVLMSISASIIQFRYASLRTGMPLPVIAEVCA